MAKKFLKQRKNLKMNDYFFIAFLLAIIVGSTILLIGPHLTNAFNTVIIKTTR